MDVGVQFDGFAVVLQGPFPDVGEEIFAYALRAQVGVDDDVVDFQLFSRIEADGYPAIGHGHQFMVLPEAEAMVGREFEHLCQLVADCFRRGGGVQFICERDDGVAVADGQFPEFKDVVCCGGLRAVHDGAFCRSDSGCDTNIQN